MTPSGFSWRLAAISLLAWAMGACANSAPNLAELTESTNQFGPTLVSYPSLDAGHAGGASGDAGDAGSAPLGVLPSPGCGKDVPSGQLLARYSKYTTHVTGATIDPTFTVPAHDRDYYVWLPADYDPTKPYRVTFLFSGCGSRYVGATQTYKLMLSDPESIYVGMNEPPTGLPPLGKDCYDNEAGTKSIEWEFMGLTATTVQNTFCIDENRLFVAGYSSGGWVSDMFGCYFAGKDPSRKFGPDISVRGQSSVTGEPGPPVPCGGKVAAMWIHDTNDTDNPIAGNLMTALPRVLAVNDCMGGASGPTKPWGSTTLLSDVCKQYTACPADYPVIFCTTSLRYHNSQDDRVLPGFIEFQNMMNPK